MKKLVRLLIVITTFFAVVCDAKVGNQASLSDKPLAQDIHHSAAIKRIVDRLSQSHYVHFSLNDSLSNKLFDNYLEQLDPKRVLFTESDIEKFADKKNRLDDELKAGQIDTAYELFRLAQQRYQEQVNYSLDLLKKPMFFEGNDIIQLDRSKLARPKTKDEQQLLWYSMVKNDAIQLLVADKKWPDVKKLLTKRYTNARQQILLSNSEDVFNIFINSFVAVLDPHTSYLSPNDTANFMTFMSLSLEGIGATLESVDGYTQIASLLANGPAAKSNKLSVGDRIVGVGQGNNPIVDVIGWRLDDVTALIKGPKGSKVRLEILPKKSKQKKTITLKREQINFEDSKVRKDIKQINNKSIAVVTIPSFYIGVAQDTEQLLKELNKDNVDGLVIDLRMNGGGALIEVVHLSDLFLPKLNSPIVQVRTSDGRVNAYTKNNTKSEEFDISLPNSNQIKRFYYDKPMVVLVDRLSVSASEIFAAAMQDYGRAVIIGETTFGKGTVQESVALDRVYDAVISPTWKPFGSLRFTNQKFYRISGGSTQLKGVEPDLDMITLNQALGDIGEQFEKNVLPWDKISSAKYSKLSGLDKWMTTLKRQHEARLKNNSDYQFILQYLQRLQLQKKEQRTLSLNLTQRKEQANIDDKILIDHVNEQLKRLGQKSVSSFDDLPKDYQLPDIYLDEAVLVVADLLELQNNSVL